MSLVLEACGTLHDQHKHTVDATVDFERHVP